MAEQGKINCPACESRLLAQEEFADAEYVKSVVDGIVEQDAELEADAKRYRYLRERYERSGFWPSPYWVQHGESVDAAIDKAIEVDA